MIAQATSDPNLVVRLYQSIDFLHLLFAVGVVAAAYLSNRGADRLLEHLAERLPRYRLVAKRAGSFLRLGLFFVASYLVVLVLLQGNRTLLYAVGGTVLVAAGLGMKGTVSSILSGIVLLVDQPFQVGDQVEFDGDYGEVTAIGLRSVQILTREDREVTVPNHRFLTDAVKSTSGGGLDMMVELDFHIAVTEDHQLARDLVYEACISSRFSHAARPVEVQVHERDHAMGLSTVLTARTYIFDARDDGSFKTDVIERVRRAFRRHDIQRPYQRTYEIRSRESADDPTAHEQYVRGGRVEE